jgi:hypothetical protein
LAQLLQTGAPASEYEPAAQAMQVLSEEAPLFAECVPAAQAMQVL